MSVIQSLPNHLQFSLRPEPDELVEVYCEACGNAVQRRYAIQCPDCLMEFHSACFWDLDEEYCQRCTCRRAARLEHMLWRMRQDVVEDIRWELITGRSR